ncbi:MAG: potassium-transporting ATPase subunit KdpC [Deltaproteobacteria bacterium]|nr:potassium-transporting ATPase subunit KdpC [Deltaproteobacteria bacterium]
MPREMFTALRMTLVTLVLTGILYPLVSTGLAQFLFPTRANGSLVTDDRGRVVGSELLAQRFAGPAYLQPRPSAAGLDGYDATSSSGSNLGPTSKVLRQRVEDEIERLRRENPTARSPIPVELVTASASGLDPHLSAPAALWQADRVASARGVTRERVVAIVEAQTEPRDLGFLGEPRVNVLRVNLALDRQFGAPH